MTHMRPGPRSRHPWRLVFGTALLLASALAVTGGCSSSAGVTSSATSAQAEVPPDAPGQLEDGRRRRLGVGDGALPEGVTVFDERHPAVTNLDPQLLRALREAGTAAEAAGIDLIVNSGWRSARYQEQLFEQAVSEYGTEAAAAGWVARPGTSVHEAGGAVDLGPQAALTWLSAHGASHGLCQIYVNEPWHFELRPTAVDDGCPKMYPDPTHDPRLHR